MEDFPINVNRLEIPRDFVVIDIEEESSNIQDWELLLGRPFMATENLKIDVVQRKLAMQYLNKVWSLSSIN